MSGRYSSVEPARVVIEALRLDRWPVAEVERRAHAAISAGVAGFVLFGGGARTVESLCRDLRTAAGRPLWLAADLERGAGQQFSGCTQLPPPAAFSNHPDPVEATRLAARITGREARGLGLNWVLAPVLDLDIEPQNPIVATRSFGAEPEQVAALGRAWIDACQAQGVATCAKHFPGHGRTRADSHMELPVVDAPAELLADDLVPFREVADLVCSIMPGHVAYPALGEDGPATRSAAIVTELLRGEVGFGGVVATDAMIMGGFGSDAADGAVAAIQAGCDLLLYPRDVDETARALADGAARDPGLEARLRESIDRSEAQLARLERVAGRGAHGHGLPALGREDDSALHLATSTILDKTGDALSGWERHRGAEVWIASDDPADPETTPTREFGAAFVRELRAVGWRVVAASRSESVRPVQRIVLLEATPRGWKGWSGLSPRVTADVDKALRTADLALPIVFGHPRILEQVKGAGVCAWSGEPVMERAAARWLDRAVVHGSGCTIRS